MNERNCRWCGEPLTYSGKGRPRVAHEGACARQHRNRREFAWRKARMLRALRASTHVSSAVGHVSGLDLDPSDDGEQLRLEQRLGRAGFSILRDSPPAYAVSYLIEAYEDERRLMLAIARRRDARVRRVIEDMSETERDAAHKAAMVRWQSETT